MARHPKVGGTMYYDCASCEQRPALKAMLGHDGPPEALWLDHLTTGEKLARCPIRDLLDASPDVRRRVLDITEMWTPLYRDGFLMAAGGVGHQPAWYVDAMLHQQYLTGEEDRKLTELLTAATGGPDVG